MTINPRKKIKTVKGEISPPIDALGFARVDLLRKTLKGFPEVVFGEGKSVGQLQAIALSLASANDRLLITRISSETFQRVVEVTPRLKYHAEARCAYLWPSRPPLQLALRASDNGSMQPDYQAKPRTKPDVLVLTAGTVDIGCAEEAALTAALMGCTVDRLYDVGVAGLHRLLSQLNRLRQARVIVVAAGMDGALASVVSGLCSQPVIGLPTPVGYGFGGQGEGALFSMLQACAAGLTVVNIGNGFGAGFSAAQIVRAIHSKSDRK